MVIPTGANIYGLDNTATNGNLWVDEDQLNGFSSESFDVDFSLANVTTTGTGSVSLSATPALTDTVSAPAAGDAVTFTLVVKGIYVSGAAATAANNLLATPVTVNVTVAK